MLQFKLSKLYQPINKYIFNNINSLKSSIPNLRFYTPRDSLAVMHKEINELVLNKDIDQVKLGLNNLVNKYKYLTFVDLHQVLNLLNHHNAVGKSEYELLIKLCSSNGDILNAKKYWKELNNIPNIVIDKVVYEDFVKVLSHRGSTNECLQIIDQMRIKGISTTIVFSIVMNMCVHKFPKEVEPLWEFIKNSNTLISSKTAIAYIKFKISMVYSLENYNLIKKEVMSIILLQFDQFENLKSSGIHEDFIDAEFFPHIYYLTSFIKLCNLNLKFTNYKQEEEVVKDLEAMIDIFAKYPFFISVSN